eukprot:284157-Chlamydomonas_euryale.AAC.7
MRPAAPLSAAAASSSAALGSTHLGTGRKGFGRGKEAVTRNLRRENHLTPRLTTPLGCRQPANKRHQAQRARARPHESFPHLRPASDGITCGDGLRACAAQAGGTAGAASGRGEQLRRACWHDGASERSFASPATLSGAAGQPWRREGAGESEGKHAARQGPCRSKRSRDRRGGRPASTAAAHRRTASKLNRPYLVPTVRNATQLGLTLSCLLWETWLFQKAFSHSSSSVKQSLCCASSGMASEGHWHTVL